MNPRENLLRAWRFQQPQTIPITVSLPPQVWLEYDPAEIEDICLSHRRLFPDFRPGSVDPARLEFPPELTPGRPYTDPWGCQWRTPRIGMYPAVFRHALANWADFEGYHPPDPAATDGFRPVDWAAIRRDAEAARAADEIVWISIAHGHTWLRLQDLRGYENVIYDMADGDDRLWSLIGMVERFNLGFLDRAIALRPDVIGIPEDLGMQSSPMLSPEMFRTYVKPTYARMTRRIRQAGILVHEHCDGYVMDLIDDLLEAGGDVLNLQDRVNGLDALAAEVKGRAAIDLDVDRQHVTMHGSPGDVDDWIHRAVATLSSPAGGLSLMYHAWPPTPVRNIRAACDAMEKYCTHRA